jgi:hypothetical protein
MFLYSNNIIYEKLPGEKIRLNENKTAISGIWGGLVLSPFIMQPTDEFVKTQIDQDELYKMFQSSSKWFFKNASLSEINAIFKSADLSGEICNELISHTAVHTEGSGYVTSPPDNLLWCFSSETRAKLYPLIGKYSINTMYSDPVCFSSDNADEWFYDSSLDKGLSDNYNFFFTFQMIVRLNHLSTSKKIV